MVSAQAFRSTKKPGGKLREIPNPNHQIPNHKSQYVTLNYYIEESVVFAKIFDRGFHGFHGFGIGGRGMAGHPLWFVLSVKSAKSEV